MSSLNPAAGASTILPAPATGRDASRGRLLADLSSAIDTSIAILGRSQTAPSSVSRRSPERPPAPLQREQSSPQPFRPAGVTQRLFETPSASAAARPAGSGRPGPLAAERPGPVPEPAPYSTTRLTADGFLVPSPRPPARGAYPAAAERQVTCCCALVAETPSVDTRLDLCPVPRHRPQVVTTVVTPARLVPWQERPIFAEQALSFRVQPHIPWVQGAWAASAFLQLVFECFAHISYSMGVSTNQAPRFSAEPPLPPTPLGAPVPGSVPTGGRCQYSRRAPFASSD